MSLIINRWWQWVWFHNVQNKANNKTEGLLTLGKEEEICSWISGHIIRIIPLLKFRELSFSDMGNKPKHEQVRNKEIKLRHNWKKIFLNIKNWEESWHESFKFLCPDRLCCPQGLPLEFFYEAFKSFTQRKSFLSRFKSNAISIMQSIICSNISLHQMD